MCEGPSHPGSCPTQLAKRLSLSVLVRARKASNCPGKALCPRCDTPEPLKEVSDTTVGLIWESIRGHEGGVGGGAVVIQYSAVVEGGRGVVVVAQMVGGVDVVGGVNVVGGFDVAGGFDVVGGIDVQKFPAQTRPPWQSPLVVHAFPS